jgi:hypothetical protein
MSEAPYCVCEWSAPKRTRKQRSLELVVFAAFFSTSRRLKIGHASNLQIPFHLPFSHFIRRYSSIYD